MLNFDGAQVRDLLGTLQQVTPRTITSWVRLLTELARAREIGVTFGFGEYTPGVGGVAAPVRDSTNEIVASIALSIPFGTSTSREFLQLAQRVRESSQMLSEALGSTLGSRSRGISIEERALKDPSIWMTR